MPTSQFEHLQIQPALTELIRLGHAFETPSVGSRLFPPVRTPWATPVVEYIEWGLNHFELLDTKRAMSAEFVFGTFTHTTRIEKISRYGAATRRDVEELASAHKFLRLPTLALQHPKRLVDHDIETRMQEVVFDNSSFEVGHVLTIPGGDQWDLPPGNPRGDITTAYRLIHGVTQVQPENMTLWLSWEAKEAAFLSPQWNVFLAGSGITAKPGDLSDLARFLGIGKVWSADPQTRNATGDGLESLYPGSTGVLYIEPPDGLIGLDATYGSNALWAVDWTMIGPFVSQIVDEKLRTSKVWTYSRHSLASIISPGAAVRIDDISSLVP